ncbi:MAG: hypothetical protein LBP65_02295 [Puniceicoccales bacterium]|nr:hypothetical protein [Puniceicoccales bacterium]
MKRERELVILSGGISGEREISLNSGRRAWDVLRRQLPCRLMELEDNVLPKDLDPAMAVIFPIIHGDFGEDGRLQRLLERQNFSYVGSGHAAMELTICKSKTKERVASAGVPILPSRTFSQKMRPPSFAELCHDLSAQRFFFKPDAMGSSLFCRPIHGSQEWNAAVAGRGAGDWLVEPLCSGREFTVGLLEDRALAVVEIEHGQEFLSYSGKYCAGQVRHICPAPIEKAAEKLLRQLALQVFKICGCRDWARVDFLMDSDGRPFFLEINAIPGFTATSLYPDSAAGVGIAPDELLRTVVARAWEDRAAAAAAA